MKKEIFSKLTLKHTILALIAMIYPGATVHAQITPTYITEHIILDGRLDEAVWQQAQVIDEFTQKELQEGAPATEQTKVHFLYDDNNLYVGFICQDSEPEKIVHKELKRDSDLRYEDRIGLVIDTYNDSRMGYFFGTNPNGMMFDATLQAVGNEKMNNNWDGIWDVRSGGGRTLLPLVFDSPG